jgi:putative ABC transport system permease protein
MLKHYLVTALRNLSRNRIFTTINIVGLSVSIAIFLALTSYVTYQFSFDKFYPGADRIFRVNYSEYQEGVPLIETARTHDRAALLVHEYVPQVEAVCRIYHEKAYVWTENVKLVDQNMLYADSSFFQVFDVKLISGSRESVLKAPLSVAISQSQAKAYFGEQDPMGKTIFFNERLPFIVTGVFEDIPDNTSIEYDFLLSWSTLWFYGWTEKDGNFDTPYTLTFLRLKENVTDIQAVSTALSKMADDHIQSLKLRGHTGKYELRALSDLHTGKDLNGEIKPGTSKTLLYALLSLAIFILIAAWINYVNLSVARLIERADEIGVRKVFGATRIAISGQFFLEAIILSLFTFFLGFLFYLYFSNNISEWLAINISFERLETVQVLIYMAAFVGGTTLIAFYPAYFVSRYKPVLILKNKLGSGKGRSNYLYQSLMVFQLFLSIAVVGITLIAGRQIAYMRQFDSGFNAAQTITLRAPASTNSDSLRYVRYSAFRKEVLQYPEFRSGTSSFNVPGEEIRFHDESVHSVGAKNDRKQSFKVLWTDEGFMETFGLSMNSGRNFNEKEFGNACLINEAAAVALGYNSPPEAVNTEIIMSDDKKLMVVGVLNDYHQTSIRNSIEPIIFLHRHPNEYGYYSFSVESREGNYLKTLETIWSKHYPNDQFVYYFMDRFFEEQYRQDELFGSLLNLFSVISIVVASLGLFGMASISMAKRTKEIAVRKVLGASVGNLLVMLSGTYVKLICIGCLFAFPVAWYLTRQWLKEFSYRIDVQWWMILLPGLIVLATTLITISVQAIRTALANPAKSLRDQ